MSLRELADQKRKGKGHHGRLLTVKEIKRIRRKGYRAERQLVKKLRRYGFKSVRIPISAPSSEPLPDVFAVKGETIIAFEVKAPNSGRAYFREDQVKKLFEFLDMFDMYRERVAVIAGKFPYRWVFRRIEKPGDYVLQKGEKSNISFR
ncbi:hypothetical protein CW711_03000 [Candidatus Bathyarchaeota archaeon]|nr:MAG: hypothetical protein CW711_03000 [Candidatus Bathyarchaeota archaeon]